MVLPVRDINPTVRRPHINWLFIAINLAVFAWQQLALDDCERLRFVYRFAAVPSEMTSLSPLSGSTVDALLGPCAPPPDTKLVLVSVVTSMFLHANLLHLAGNLLFLFVFGDNVEDRLGPIRYVIFYFMGGVASALAYGLLSPASTVPLVGASGAIAAVLGAYLVLFPGARVLCYVPFPLYLLALLIPRVTIRLWFVIFALVKMPAWLLLGGWLALQFVGVRSPDAAGIAYEAHIAGFIAGIALVLILDRWRSRHGRATFHPTGRRSTRRRAD